MYRHRDERGNQLHIEKIPGPRVTLTPLAVEDAGPMVAVLAAPELYVFTGGEAPSKDELVARYSRQVAGAPEGSHAAWLNWVVRLGEQPVGYVQATVQGEPGAHLAELAWVIGADWQGLGLAAEASRLMRDWLQTRGIDRFIATIHPDHAASERIASGLGLTATADLDGDGERVWDTRTNSS